jgi:hypothetical protein
MCPRKPERYFSYQCNHEMFEGVCEWYGPKQNICYASDPASPLRPNLGGAKYGGLLHQKCWFCENGRDINPGGAYESGPLWRDVPSFRK